MVALLLLVVGLCAAQDSLAPVEAVPLDTEALEMSDFKDQDMDAESEERTGKSADPAIGFPVPATGPPPPGPPPPLVAGSPVFHDSPVVHPLPVPHHAPHPHPEPVYTDRKCRVEQVVLEAEVLMLLLLLLLLLLLPLAITTALSLLLLL